MTRKDVRQIGAWAVATAIVALCSVGLRESMAQRTKNDFPPMDINAATISGLLLKATANPQHAHPKEVVAITVSASNESKTQKSFSGLLKIERTRFGGNPMSRVVLPKEIVRTQVLSRPFSLSVPPSGSKSITIGFVAPELQPAPKSKETGRNGTVLPATGPMLENYEATMVVGGKTFRLTGFTVSKKVVDH